MNSQGGRGRPIHPGRAVFLIARREFLSRVRSRVFVIGTAAVVVLLAVYVALQVLVINRINTNPPSNVGFSGQASVLATPFRATAAALGIPVQVRSVPDEAPGEAQVRSGSLDALVTGAPDSPQVLVKDHLSSALRSALDSAVRQQVLNAQLSAAGLDPQEVETRVATARLQVRSLQPGPQRNLQQALVGFVTAWVLYIALQLYGNFIAQGVVEDKSSRIVEILLSTVRPSQLLLGKVIGIGLVGLLQLAVIGGAGLLLTIPTHVLSVPKLAAGAVAIGLLWFVLGFVLYGILFAAAGSLVSRQEDVGTTVLPIVLLLLASILLAYIVVIPGLGGGELFPVATTVLSLLPPFAPVLMPIRMDAGDAPAWQALLAMALTVAAAGILTWVGGRIYANSVLRIGARVRLREVLRETR